MKKPDEWQEDAARIPYTLPTTMPGVRWTKLENYAGPEDFASGRGTPGAAGIDLYAADSYFMYPGDKILVRTGLRIAMPTGMEAQVRARSGLALKKNVLVVNGPGTIDADYRGEIGVILQNNAPVIPYTTLVCIGTTVDWITKLSHYTKEHTVHIQKGDKVAQLVFAQYLTPPLFEVSQMESTARGEGGFGSTGTK